MRRKILLRSLMVAWCLLCSSGVAQTLYPQGYDISCNYGLSHSSIAIGDTLTITSSIKNNESFVIEDLCFSDNFPNNFVIISSQVTVNGSNESIEYYQGPSGLVVSDYSYSTWQAIDGGTTMTIGPGDSVALVVKVVPTELGTFAFDHNALVFNGVVGSFFTLADEAQVTVVLWVDVEWEDEVTPGLPAGMLLTTAYPNPFNGEVNVMWSGQGIAQSPITLEVFNVLGQRVLVESRAAGGDEGVIVWRPTEHRGSGLYFYRISTAGASSRGKLIFVK